MSSRQARGSLLPRACLSLVLLLHNLSANCFELDSSKTAGPEAESNKTNGCVQKDEAIENLTKTELLHRSTECITTGYVPPILARMLYGDKRNTSWGPWQRATTGWNESLPDLTSEREAGPFGLHEVVRTGVQWFATLEAAEDYRHALQSAALSAAREDALSDPILRYGPPAEYKQEDRFVSNSLQDSLLRKTAFAVRHAITPRVSAELPPLQLSDDAVGHLRHIRQLLRQRDKHLVPNATLDFFRRFGTHVAGGPVLFGGMVVAQTEEVRWKTAGTNETAGARAQADCELRRALQGFGLSLPCDAPHRPLAGSVVGVRATAQAVRGGDRGSGSGWARSVQWSKVPSSSWAVVDRGLLLPIWTLVSVHRDPELTMPIRLLLEEAYVALWREANPRILHAAAAAGDAGAVRMLILRGVGVEESDEQGRTALHEAAWAGQAGAMAALLVRGARVDRADRSRRTALHLAAVQDHAEACELLLDRGADLLKTDGSALTPLQLAVSTRSHRAERVLRQRLMRSYEEL